MNWLSLCKVLGGLWFAIGIAMIIPCVLSAFLQEPQWLALLLSSCLLAGCGATLMRVGRPAQAISVKGGFFLVTICWVGVSAGGALPYILSGNMTSLSDAFFESVSGFTTTGASILQATQYAQLGKGMLLWRSMTQWFGGMGIIVLGLVIFPTLGVGGIRLYRREMPGLFHDVLVPRVGDIAKRLWGLYLLLTVVLFLALLLCNLSFFDAINHALTGIATGGFSTHPNSIGGFNNPLMEWVLASFLIISAINYALHFRLLQPFSGGVKDWFNSLEMRTFITVLVASILMMSAYLHWKLAYPLPQALTKGMFQVVNLSTSTGYSSADYTLWGGFPQILLLALMTIGGCAGSTSGGIKWIRVVLLAKYIHRELIRLMHPRMVRGIKIDNIPIEEAIQSGVYTLMGLFGISVIIWALLISLTGVDFVTALGASVSAFANTGPAFGAAGPASNYAAMADGVKWLLMMAMIMGRLELITVFMLFLPTYWGR